MTSAQSAVHDAQAEVLVVKAEEGAAREDLERLKQMRKVATMSRPAVVLHLASSS